MDAELKAEIQEIVELVKTLPDLLQVRTLEILLQDLIDRRHGQKGSTKDGDRRKAEDELHQENEKVKKSGRERRSEGIDPNTLPMRVKAFMKRTKVTDKQIERLFHIEGKEYEPIWTLKSTTFAKTQVQIALLQALKRALTSGEFSFDREEVKEKCETRNCLNKTNFKANFQNSSKYFSGLEKDGLVSLTDEGMTALAALVTTLAGGDDGD